MMIESQMDCNGATSPGGLTPTEAGSSIQKTDRLRKASDDSQILIVDDDPILVEMVAKMVEALGYRTTTAVDGLDALKCLGKAYYRLVITDYNMPFMDGYQLAIQVKDKSPMSRVIIMSGYFERPIVDMMKKSTMVDGLLSKPFNLKALKEKIEHVERMGPPPWSL